MIVFGGIVPPLGCIESRVRATLEPSVAFAGDDMEALIAQIERGNAICWTASVGDDLRAVAVTEVREAHERQCYIRHCAGTGVRGWIHFIAEIEAWARWFGCDSIALEGRTGWQRLLGWNRRGNLLTKALVHGRLQFSHDNDADQLPAGLADEPVPSRRFKSRQSRRAAGDWH